MLLTSNADFLPAQHNNLMSQIAARAFLSYRNAYYQGESKDQRRHGSGLLMIDEGLLIVGQWKQDLAYGAAFCFLSSEEYAFLDFNRGEL